MKKAIRPMSDEQQASVKGGKTDSRYRLKTVVVTSTR